MSEREIREYITNALAGNDASIVQMAKDLNTKDRSRTMIEELKITEKTFQRALVGICNVLFSDKCSRGYYMSLLIFCIELDSFHEENSSWYSRDMLVETLITILLKTECKRKRHYFEYIWLCSILLIISGFMLLL